ncbi:hypothetical protein GF378_03130 [Candidatus Pacearchaeota archaeon]|nr:hypothetical protein [Candidatus Pacearchaeota archaeon]
MSHHKKTKKSTSNQNKESFFKKKATIALFAIIALIGGTLFIDQPITGNVVLNNYHSIHSVSIIGMVLVFCSTILVGYYIYKSI